MSNLFRRDATSCCCTVPQPRRHAVGFAEILLAEQGIYRLRIAAAEDLLDEGASVVDQTAREGLGGARLLLIVQATRATHIFESVIALCRIGSRASMCACCGGRSAACARCSATHGGPG